MERTRVDCQDPGVNALSRLPQEKMKERKQRKKENHICTCKLSKFEVEISELYQTRNPPESPAPLPPPGECCASGFLKTVNV